MLTLFGSIFLTVLITQANDKKQPPKPKLSEGCDWLMDFKRQSEFKIALKNIPSEDLSATFDNYSPKNESQEKALQLVRKFSAYDGDRSIGLFLSGTPGLGKTHLVVAAAREAFSKGQNVLFVTPETIFDFTRIPKKTASSKGGVEDPITHFAKEFFGSKTRDYIDVSVIEALKKYDLVILDDLNQYAHVHHYTSVFQDVVGWAYASQRKKVIITSNVTLSYIVDKLAQGEQPRVTDRGRALFISAYLDGESARPSADWDKHD